MGAKDTCEEICGDGLNMGRYECDDGNTINGDGCNNDCQTEPGWSCSGGSPTGPDTCTTICGDGINPLIKHCDDGNILNGDGCSSTCNIEPGWVCQGGSINSKDVCYD